MASIINYQQPSLKTVKAAEKLLITSASTPGWTSAITSAVEMKIALGRIRDGVFHTSPTLVFEGGVTFITHTFALVYGWVTLSSYFGTASSIVSSLLNNSTATLTKVATVAQNIFQYPVFRFSAFGIGFVVCLINGVFESIGLVKQINLRRTLDFSTKIDPDNATEKLQALLDYFELPEEKDFANEAHTIKRNELVGPWLVEKIEEQIHANYEDLEHGTPAEKDNATIWLQETYELINIQSKKALITHSIGLIGILTDMIASAFSLVPATWPLFALFAILSLACTSARYIFYHGYFNSQGFQPANLIPISVRENAQKAKNALTSLLSKDINVADAKKIDIPHSSLFLSFFRCPSCTAVPA